MGDAYLGVKRREGRYRDYRVVVERPGRQPIAVGVLAKRVPLLGEWWHLPAGPAGESTEAVLEVAAAVARFARDRGAFLLKIEPRLGLDARAAIHAAGYRDTVRIVPNPSTVLVDLGDPSAVEDALFASLGKKARNSINRARRDGIEVTRAPATDENCAALYGLLRETAEGRFVLRREGYYREFWQAFEREGSGQIFLAYRADPSGKEASHPSDADATASGAAGEPRLVAGAFAMGLGAKTTYKDGASVRAKTAYGASHALQWEVLRWAHERGATVHDLCGAPPNDRADDKGHPLHGVGQFKRSFSPEITDYAGAFDLPLKPRAYAIWSKLGDRIARRASLALKKDPYY
nr:peptidoglycan bridge formation glycyltransferase FemA/FemB family protein [Leucobacter ruminantium]